MGILSALIITSIIGSLAAAGASIGSAVMNKQSVEKTNEQNIEMQRETNAQNQYNIEHAHQIEMADLQAAGLNPVLTATGGSGAPIQSLNAPKAQAPQVDLSGVSSAMSGISHLATTAMIMDMKQSLAAEHNKTIAAIANGRNAQSAANAALRADTLDKLYQRKAMSFSREGYANVNSAKSYSGAADKVKEKEVMDWIRKTFK